MAEEFRVVPALLHLTSSDIESTGLQYAADGLRHRSALIAALARWQAPASRAALEQAISRWEVRHGEHLRRAGGLGLHVTDAALAYTADSAGSTDLMNSVLEAVIDTVEDATTNL